MSGITQIDSENARADIDQNKEKLLALGLDGEVDGLSSERLEDLLDSLILLRLLIMNGAKHMVARTTDMPSEYSCNLLKIA